MALGAFNAPTSSMIIVRSWFPRLRQPVKAPQLRLEALRVEFCGVGAVQGWSLSTPGRSAMLYAYRVHLGGLPDQHVLVSADIYFRDLR